MLDRSRRFILRLLRLQLSAAASPFSVAIAILVLGVALAWSVSTTPSLAQAAILMVTAILTTYALFLAYLVKKETVRLSDIAETPHYPYVVINSEMLWIIHDSRGKEATLVKKKIISPLEPLSVVREYVWGNAKPPHVDDFHIEKFTLRHMFRQGSMYVFEIALDRTYHPRESLELLIRKDIHDGFIQDSEWVESLIPTEAHRQVLAVELPADRPAKSARAVHRHGDFSFTYPLGDENFESRYIDGRQRLIWTLRQPVIRDRYTIEWDW